MICGRDGTRRFLGFPARDQTPGPVECFSERGLLPERPVEIGIAEIGPLPLVVASKRGAVRARRCDHQRVRIRKRRDEAARVTGGDDDDAPFDTGSIEHALQHARRQMFQAQARHHDRQQRPFPVRGQKQKERVPAGVHDLPHVLQRALEVLRTGEREFIDRGDVIDERDRSATGPEPRIEQFTHGHDLALEHSLGSVTRKADEIEMARWIGRRGRLQLRQCTLDDCRLVRTGQRPYRDQRREVAAAPAGAPRRVPPMQYPRGTRPSQ